MLRLAIVIPASLAALLLVLAQPGGGDRSRTVGGWLVEDRAEQDGGRLVRLSRSAGGARIQYSAAFWRGNDGRIQALLVERSDCTDGEELGRHGVSDARRVRAILAGLLERCAVSPRRIGAALAGFERAYALALDWARAAEAATAAEAGATADHGRR